MDVLDGCVPLTATWEDSVEPVVLATVPSLSNASPVLPVGDKPDVGASMGIGRWLFRVASVSAAIELRGWERCNARSMTRQIINVEGA